MCSANPGDSVDREDKKRQSGRMLSGGLLGGLIVGLLSLTCGRQNPASAPKPGSILLRVMLSEEVSSAQAASVSENPDGGGRKDRTPGLAKVVNLGMTISLDCVVKVTRNVSSGT